jgi:uncharacterized protein (DUF1778 family)
MTTRRLLQVRLTDREAWLLKHASRAVGESVSALVRRVVFSECRAIVNQAAALHGPLEDEEDQT